MSFNRTKQAERNWFRRWWTGGDLSQPKTACNALEHGLETIGAEAPTRVAFDWLNISEGVKKCFFPENQGIALG